MKDIQPNFGERMLYLFAPEKGEKRFAARLKRESEASPRPSGGRSGAVMAASGYGNHGASTTLNSLIGWIVGGGSAEDDIDAHGATLRTRARDLYAGGGLARSGPATMVTNVVGWGIQPKPKIDGELLGMSAEACTEWERNAKREFNLWASNPMCDAERQKDFFTIQQLTFRSMLVSGDVFVLFGMKENKRTPYQTTLRVIEADRISTPESSGDSEAKETDGGGRIVDGVEIDAEGAVIRYHLTNRHPLMESSAQEIEWIPIDAYGGDTGYPNILHVTTFERPEQRRGIPFVAAQIARIKQLDRYLDSELAANVVSAMLAAFIVSDEDDGKTGLEDAVNEDEKVSDDELDLELAPGAVYSLPPGKKVQTLNPIRSNSAFESFVTTMITIIGAGMGVPKEVVLKKYESNYTAARAALLDFWTEVHVERNAFNTQFNQPCYEMWLSEAVATGRIEAPGFFDDPAIRQAWCGCNWVGSSMGHVDPLKEVKAAGERIRLNISTEEQEAGEYNGGDWAAIIRQRKVEIAETSAMTAESGGEGTGNNTPAGKAADGTTGGKPKKGGDKNAG